MNDICIFTIVSRNYLHYARTLLNSIKEHHQNIDFHIGLCDIADGVDLPEKEFQLLELKDITLPDWDDFVFRYTILELNTAIKPFIISDFLNKGYKKVIYFDPDICVYRSLENMFSLLDDNDILITPHLTGLLDDDKQPSELTIMRSGVYNLGYLGLKNTDNTKAFINWWKDKLTYGCVVDLENGLFVDQKWVDLVPGIFENVHIERNSGWNTAYWNLKHRAVEKAKNGYTVNGEPLTFFHYSGFNIDNKTLSKHQNRFSKKSAGNAVFELSADYSNRLIKHGIKGYQKIPYHYGNFASGATIPDMARYIFRENIEKETTPKGSAYEQGGDEYIIKMLNKPVTISRKKYPWITSLAKRLYDAREDLQLAFPDLTTIDGVRYAEWFVGSATEQANMEACFIAPVEQALAELRSSTQASSNESLDTESTENEDNSEKTANAPVAVTVSQKKPLAKKVYDFAWRHRHVGRFTMPQQHRRRLHSFLLSRVYPSTPGSSLGDVLAEETDNQDISSGVSERGLNVIGYLNAESGVGESARATIRALEQVEFPLSLYDFRVGNISRMGESVNSDISNQCPFSVNLFHINADQMPVVREHLDSSVFQNAYNIGYWAWELTEFPDDWLASLDYLDEIWVPSTFCQKAIAQKSSVPVLVFPHSVSSQGKREAVAGIANINKAAYKFLFMFDALSLPERKNPQAVIQAFRKAKSDAAGDTTLIIKVTNLDKVPEFSASFRKECQEVSDIVLIEEYLSREQIRTLHDYADCFISLHRSEGFGLGMAEAMAHGKPVIATNWSGNTDFIDMHSALPVPYTLKALNEDYGPYKSGQQWADPSWEYAAEKMTWLVDKPEEGYDIGAKAQQAISAYCSPAEVGRQMKSRVERIYKQLTV